MKKILFFSLMVSSSLYGMSPKKPIIFLPLALQDYYQKHPKDGYIVDLINILNTPQNPILKKLDVHRSLKAIAYHLNFTEGETKRMFDLIIQMNNLDSGLAGSSVKSILPPLQSKISRSPSPLRMRQYRISPILSTTLPKLTEPKIPIEPKYSTKLNFRNIAGGVPQEVKDLKEILDENPYYRAVGAKKPTGILFYGLPGTGKSLLIESIAGELDVPIIKRSGSSFINQYVGVGPQALREMFVEAMVAVSFYKRKLAIIAIDEIDAIGSERKSEGSSEYRNTLAALLSLMDGINEIGIDKNKLAIMATTNIKSILDKALIRPGRFDKLIEIKKPDKLKREAVLKLHFFEESRKTEEPIDFNKIAEITDDFNCSELKYIVNESALIAARNQRGIKNEDFELAVKSKINAVKEEEIKKEEEKRKAMLAAYKESYPALTEDKQTSLYG